MEMHQIRYFLAAASERNFTKAAAQCSVSPPSLMRAIKLLEAEFGGPLFNRERSNTHLTELGRIALPHLQQVLKESMEAKLKARDFLNFGTATLKVGIMCTIAPAPFVALIEAFRKSCPNVVLRIEDASAQRLQSALITGELEVALYALPGQEAHERTHALPLYREQMVIAVSSGHGLAKKKLIQAIDLDGEPYLDRINCEFTGFADKLFAEKSINGPTVYQSERDDWVLAMVAAGMGYGFLPQSLANYPGIVSRPLVDPEFWRTINLVTVRGRLHSPAVGAFVREVMRVKWQGKEALAVKAARRGGGTVPNE